MAQNKCPNCSSYKTENQRKLFIGIGLFLALGSIPWFWLIFPIFILLVGIGVFSYGLTISSSNMLCKTCGYRFQKVSA